MTKLEKVFVSWYGQDEWDKIYKNKYNDCEISEEEKLDLEDISVDELLNDLGNTLIRFFRNDEVDSYLFDMLEDEVSKEDLYINEEWYMDIFKYYIIPDCLEGNKEYIDII